MTNHVHAQTATPADFAPETPSFLKATGKAISGFLSSFAMALAAQRLYYELEGLSDLELEKLGITRQDIPGLVAKRLGWMDVE